MKSACCPSCGAPVVFRSAASLYAVCEFCRSTLLRSGEDLRNLGRMADLLEDASLLRIGSEGRFRGVHFGVIGRIQLKHESGLWNEWHILFDDGRSAWLSEAGGEYVVSEQRQLDEALPAFDTLSPEMPLTLDGHPFTVTCLDSACCIAGQGELPFRVESGYEVNTADLRGGGRFATLDYSETPPLFFVGQPVAFAELKLAHLRERDGADGSTAQRIEVRVFNCPHCAAPLALHSPAIKSVACDSCGSIIGVNNENMKILARAARALRETPPLPLGSRGELQGVAWEAIGFMRRKTSSEGVDYSWSEILLFNAEQGFAWLIEYRGHWNFARTLAKPPPVGPKLKNFKFQEREFKLFSRGQAKVSYVVGEFYWRVAVGESCAVDDYVCPPLMLSREVSSKEASWSQSEYLEPDIVRAAFKLNAPMPERVGVYANQPNPRVDSHRRVCRNFWLLALAATALQLAFVLLAATNVVLKQQLELPPRADESSLVSREFTLPGRARTLRVSHRTDIDNNWLALTTLLVDKDSGQSWQSVQELGHYHGIDDGESWSEGERNGEIVFRSIPPGTYYLAIDYELGGEAPHAVADRVEVVRNAPGWSNYVLALIFLAVFPLVSRWRRAAFEAERWSESETEGGD